MQHHQRQGRRMSSLSPYGWKINPEDKTRLIQNEDEQVAVQYIQELAAEGRTAWGITKIMNQEMQGHARGKNWHRKTVVKIIPRNWQV
jgi:uncharacterized protein YoaH (UPF0181 family)